MILAVISRSHLSLVYPTITTSASENPGSVKRVHYQHLSISNSHAVVFFYCVFRLQCTSPMMVKVSLCLTTRPHHLKTFSSAAMRIYQVQWLIQDLRQLLKARCVCNIHSYLTLPCRKILEEISVCHKVCAVGEIEDPQSHIVHKVCQVHVDGEHS